MAMESHIFAWENERTQMGRPMPVGDRAMGFLDTHTGKIYSLPPPIDG